MVSVKGVLSLLLGDAHFAIVSRRLAVCKYDECASFACVAPIVGKHLGADPQRPRLRHVPRRRRRPRRRALRAIRTTSAQREHRALPRPGAGEWAGALAE